MSRDKGRDHSGPWWYGWVRYTYYDFFSKSEKEGRRLTYLDFATAGQAQRAADALAGALAGPQPLSRRDRRYRSKTQKLPSPFTIVETGASRVEA